MTRMPLIWTYNKNTCDQVMEPSGTVSFSEGLLTVALNDYAYLNVNASKMSPDEE